jgi:methyl-accepting chemotaxis protein
VTGAIQSETNSAIAVIRLGSQQASNGAALARKAADALQRIDDGAKQTLEMSAEIAATMTQLAGMSGRIAELVTNIIGLAERNAGCADNTLAQANQLESLATNLEEIGVVFKLGRSGEEAARVHARMPQLVQAATGSIGKLLEEAIDAGKLTLDDLFDQTYTPIANTQPQKFRTRFDEVCDRLLPTVQERILGDNQEIVYAIACDRRGYVPTHNKRFSEPLTGDVAKDMLSNRTKRIFDDTVGRRCGSHELPFLLQTYRRDTGEIMHDISAPVYVKGRHWGGVRIGYRTE